MKLSTKLSLALTALVVVSQSSVDSVYASPTNFWSSNGAGCVLGAGTVFASAGNVTTSTSATLYCPVNHWHNAAGESSPFILNFTHQGVITTGLSATAALIEMSKSTGAESVAMAVYGTSSSSVITESVSDVLFNPNWEDNYYYVKVTLVGSSQVGKSQTFYGVQLTY